MFKPTELLRITGRTDQEYLVLYIITVAGKRSEYASNAIERFRKLMGNDPHPLRTIYNMDDDLLDDILREARISPYSWRLKAFKHASKFHERDLLTVTPNEWANVGGEKVGIGPKSSRYICMCLDPDNARYAALDTHLLKWMRHIGYKLVPKATPPAGPWYDKIEQWFLDAADERGRNPAELDLDIWTAYKYGLEIPE